MSLPETSRRTVVTLMTLFGSYYRMYFADAGLLHSTGCQDAGHVHILADAESRTLETGNALAAGMMPGCGIRIQDRQAMEKIRFLVRLAAGIGKPDRALAAASISGRIGANPDALTKFTDPNSRRCVSYSSVAPPRTPCPAEEKPGKRSVLKQPSSLEASKGDHCGRPARPTQNRVDAFGRFPARVPEWDGWQNLGWGRLDAGKLMEVMRLHAAYADLARQTPYVARVQGSNLLSHILRSMEQAAKGSAVTGSLGESGDRVLVIVGHDTNISNIAGMLGIDWLLDGYQPDDTPPGSALVFELWEQGEARDGGKHVLPRAKPGTDAESTTVDAGRAAPEVSHFRTRLQYAPTRR